MTSAGGGRERGRPSDKPLRVCLLIGRLGLGGTEKQVTLLARGLRERGVDTTVISLFGVGERDAELCEAGIPVIYGAFRTRDFGRWRWPANVVGFFRLVGYLRGLRPDLLHAFLLYSYIVAAPAAWLAGVPVLIAGRRSLGDFKRHRPLWRALERAANQRADLLIANAEAVAEDALRTEGVPREKVSVVYNGLPDSAFDPVPPAVVETRSPVVLCVANFWRYKGHRYLLDAIAMLRDQGTPCTLVLVGQRPVGDALEQTALERQASRLGIDVLFLGPRTDVRRLLARADVVAHPSLTEGMSNAVMEAMAAGRAIVATDVGGTPELLRGCGVLVPPADAAALASGLAKVLADPAFASDLGHQARDWSLANLRLDTMIGRHLDIYHDLLRTMPAHSTNR